MDLLIVSGSTGAPSMPSTCGVRPRATSDTRPGLEIDWRRLLAALAIAWSSVDWGETGLRRLKLGASGAACWAATAAS